MREVQGVWLLCFSLLWFHPSHELGAQSIADRSENDSSGAALFAQPVRTTDPLSPDEEAGSFVLPAGFEIQLFAAEPDIAKPTNMSFDSRGRLWVSSTEEYPFPATEDHVPKDTIKVLEDTNGDGRADVVSTFADGLNIPIGLYPYRDGVICFSIPNIWFLRDTDHDGHCDQREVLFGPFDCTRDTHGMCNSFTRGPDGWLYACHGFNNDSRVSGRDGHSVHMQSGNTFRMRLDGSRIEHFTHGQVNPFGMTIDRFGDIFTADCHTKPITLLLKGGFYQSFGKPHDGLGFVPDVMNHLHGSTAICGIALGADTNFPRGYSDSIFSGDVMTCRINRNTLERTGASVRARAEPDLLSCRDPWFRPVDLKVGPDGWLYVADFYNRIIGHYEVPLNHPGRDRHRGRIWRIGYVGSDALSRTARAAGKPSRPITECSIDELLDELHGSNSTRAWAIIDHVTDVQGAIAVGPVRSRLASADPQTCVYLLWVLHRLESITDADLDFACGHASNLVRIHAYRMLGEGTVASERQRDWLGKGLQDVDPLVRRAAVMALAKHSQPDYISGLFDLLQREDPADVHLRHAIHLALRNHLQNEAWFKSFVATPLSNAKVQSLSEICLALHTEAAGDYIVQQLKSRSDFHAAQITDLARFAARYASIDSLASLAQFAGDRLADRIDLQLELLHAIHGGMTERGQGDVPPAVREWAIKLATRFLHKESLAQDGTREPPLAWSYLPHPEPSRQTNPWTVSFRRASADGLPATPLWSSFESGEERTGIYRSQSFRLEDSFSFYIAGHDGLPDDPLPGKNRVRLRDAVSDTVWQEAAAPRTDVAQPVTWDTRRQRGKLAVLELVDGNSASAFAWIAAGRFSVAGLNPSMLPANRRQAARLVTEFGLHELRDILVQLLDGHREQAAGQPQDWRGDQETAFALAQALVSLNSDPRLEALARISSVSGTDAQLIDQALKVIVSRDLAESVELLGKVMTVATSAEQLNLAEPLASDTRGIDTLLALVEAGRASALILRAPNIAQNLSASASTDQQSRISQLISSLPREDEHLANVIRNRQRSYADQPGSLEKGREVFRQNCAACHQVAGEGKRYAPNLDGIATRGLDRLLEDILAPSRNVDAAFRLTTIVTQDGKVVSGLLTRSDEAQLVLVDAKGSEVLVSKESIEQQQQSAVSPMPADFDQAISGDQFRDLLTYLLSLRGS
jgi:putative heme-binding domain-containing protein